MSEQLSISAEQEGGIEAIHGLGKVTVFEALAEETASVSMDGMGRTTMQAAVDFDD